MARNCLSRRTPERSGVHRFEPHIDFKRRNMEPCAKIMSCWTVSGQSRKIWWLIGGQKSKAFLYAFFEAFCTALGRFCETVKSPTRLGRDILVALQQCTWSTLCRSHHTLVVNLRGKLFRNASCCTKCVSH